ncbi:MAG: hypothetical protein AB1775_12060 [Bacteroidota bacterium]
MFQEVLNKHIMDDQLLKQFPGMLKSNSSVRRFTNAADEFNTLRNGVGLRIVFDSMIIKMTGKDVLDFLHRISTNALLDLQPQQKRNTLFLNDKGRFIDRATLLALDGEYQLIGSSDQNKRLLSWINKFIIMEDIKTEDLSDKFTLLELIGPQTNSFLTLMLGNEVDLNDVTKIHTLSVDGFQFLFCLNVEPNNAKVFKIIIEKEKVSNFIDYLFSIKSVFDLTLIGEDAYDAFRIQNGIPALPQEINDSANPYEVDLIGEVNFKKGCYIGQEVIARLDTYDKIQRKMMRVSLSVKMNGKNAVINSDGMIHAGIISSISNPELFNEQIGLAIVNKKALETGKQFHVLSGDEKIPVVISFLDDHK